MRSPAVRDAGAPASFANARCAGCRWQARCRANLKARGERWAPTRLTDASLGRADRLELAQGAPVVEHCRGRRDAGTLGCLIHHLQQGSCQVERATTQVGRRRRFAAQDGQHIMCLERGADSASHGLAAVGLHATHA